MFCLSMERNELSETQKRLFMPPEHEEKFFIQQCESRKE